MHASGRLLLPACMLLGAVSAIPAAAPAPTPLAARDEGNLEPWVTVDETGQPKTVTPVLTTVSGTPTVISPAPTELSPSTGTAPLPTATNVVGAGVFDVCSNRDGEFRPFCMPSNNATLYPGSIYYVTWDPTFFNGTNTTVKVVGFAHNSSSNEITLDQAFSSSNLAAGWGFYQWPLETMVLSNRGLNALNVTIRIAALNPTLQWFDGPRVLVSYPPVYHQPQAQPPTGPALYIGLPTVGGFIALVLVGTCIWNRKQRKIGLGNIMSRGRHGHGLGKSHGIMGIRSKRNRDQAVRLMERRMENLPEEEIYRDVPAPRRQEADHHFEPLDIGIARRDSDALGSLAGTPTEDRHMDFSRPRKGNAFRDELERQKAGR